MPKLQLRPLKERQGIGARLRAAARRLRRINARKKEIANGQAGAASERADVSHLQGD